MKKTRSRKEEDEGQTGGDEEWTDRLDRELSSRIRQVGNQDSGG